MSFCHSVSVCVSVRVRVCVRVRVRVCVSAGFRPQNPAVSVTRPGQYLIRDCSKNHAPPASRESNGGVPVTFLALDYWSEAKGRPVSCLLVWNPWARRWTLRGYVLAARRVGISSRFTLTVPPLFFVQTPRGVLFAEGLCCWVCVHFARTSRPSMRHFPSVFTISVFWLRCGV